MTSDPSPISVEQPVPAGWAAPTLGWLGLGAIALGIALRIALFATGRSPLDGDEAIMGAMAYHVAHLEHFALYFYGQHYMGTLEIPPVVLLMALGPEEWKVSVWPIRLTEAFYLIALCVIHFRLVARFFGPGVARWAVFFLMIAPFYWVDYTLRLRHLVLMIAMGELLALVTLPLLEDWRDRRRARPWRLLGIGLLSGAAWWHYQLVAPFFVAALLLFLLEAPFVLDWFRRFDMRSRRPPQGPRPRVMLPGALLRFVLMALSVACLSGLSLAWWANPEWGYPRLIAVLLVPWALAVVWGWRVYRRDEAEMVLIVDAQIPRSEPLHRLGPVFLSTGFLLGYAPALIHLALLREEFWIAPVQIVLQRLPSAVRDFFFLEVWSMLGITQSSEDVYPDHVIGPTSYVNLLLYSSAFYVLARLLVRPERPIERRGAAYFLAFLFALCALNVIARRSTQWDESRFLLPAIVTISVALGLLADRLTAAFAGSGARRARPIKVGLGLAIVAGAAALWGPQWIEAPRQAIAWPSGHRRSSLEMAEALQMRGIERVRMIWGLDSTLSGYELQFITRFKIRFNRGMLSDRLGGLLDESLYRGEIFRVIDTTTARGATPVQDYFTADLDPETGDPDVFSVGNWLVYPLDYEPTLRDDVTSGSLEVAPPADR